MSARLSLPRLFAPRATPRPFVVRWLPTFLGFPAGGTLAMLLTGPVDAPLPALLGGALAGAAIGGAQWLALRGRLPQAGWWVPATALGHALGLAAGSALVGYQTGLAPLAVQGAVTGLALGIAQGLTLRRSLPGWLWWMAAMPLLWALGWIVTTAAGVQVERQFTNFGSLGAIAVTLLGGLLLGRLLRDAPGRRVTAPA
ncbi:MAG: hypothetical protein QM692_17520 [Thermomicrobiales bacterium]